MTPAFIIDCSITMAWCFEDERTEAADDLLSRMARETVLVPVHWHLEVANVLAQAERRDRLTEAAAKKFIDLLKVFDVQVDDSVGLVEPLFRLCRQHSLTSYDAAYLQLALKTSLPLATLDSELRGAAAAHGVTLLGL
jgi:predicted nucleic acid-binding protein